MLSTVQTKKKCGPSTPWALDTPYFSHAVWEVVQKCAVPPGVGVGHHRGLRVLHHEVGPPGCTEAGPHFPYKCIFGSWPPPLKLAPGLVLVKLAEANFTGGGIIPFLSVVLRQRHGTNKLEVITISDPETTTASAAMDVRLGSNSDPAGHGPFYRYICGWTVSPPPRDLAIRWTRGRVRTPPSLSLTLLAFYAHLNLCHWYIHQQIIGNQEEMAHKGGGASY